MKRPNLWLETTLLLCLVVALGEFVALRVLAPVYVVRTLERLSGGKLIIGQAQMTLPLTTTLVELKVASNTDASGVSMQRVVIRPRWFSLARRTLWLDSLEIEQPLVRISRTETGELYWPAIPGSGRFKHDVRYPLLNSPLPGPWRIYINSLTVAGGTIEYVDEKPANPFHGAIDHVSMSLGRVTLSSDGAHLSLASTDQSGMSFAIRGRALGYGGAEAPLYCSGWLDLGVKDMQASCRLEPLELSSLEPYFHGPSELRAYTTTLASTSQWVSKANEFTGHLRLELGNLSEGDFSVHGRTIVDVKKLKGDEPDPSLTGEIFFSGPLDDPSAWQAEFLPGDVRVQGLVERLLEYGVTRIKVAIGDRPVYISMSPATPATMTDLEASSREVQQALELLAAPELPETAEDAAAATPATSSVEPPVLAPVDSAAVPPPEPKSQAGP